MSVELNTDLVLEEIQEQKNEQSSKELAKSAQLVSFAAVVTHHLQGTEGKGSEKKSVGDSWNINWPVAPTGGGSSVNPDPSTYPFDPFSNGDGDGYLQQLIQVFQEFKNNPTDLNLLPTLIELLSLCSNDKNITSDPTFQALMQNFPVGKDGEPDLQGFADIVVLMEMNATGGDQSKISAFISQLLAQPGVNSPLMSTFAQELESLQDPNALSAFIAPYMNNGQIGYTSYDSIYDGGENGMFIPCSQAQFYTFLGGMLGNDLVMPNGPNGNDPFGSAVNGLISGEVSELLEELKHCKDVGEALILLMMLMGSSKDQMYQNQLTGLASTTQWLSDQTNQVSQLISNFNEGNFTGDPTTAGAHAGQFFSQLIQIYESTKDNPNASGLVGPLQNALNAIFNCSAAPAGTSLLNLYKIGAKENPPYSSLAKQLAAICTNVTTGDGLTVLNSLKQISQTFTNESQAIGTQIQAVSANDNQIVNFLKSFLTDSTSGVTALENSISNNQKTS